MTIKQSLDKQAIIHDNSIFDDDLEIDMTIMSEEEINDLAAELAELSLIDDIDDEYEAMMDELFAENEALLYAAQSYDNDAMAYGEMV